MSGNLWNAFRVEEIKATRFVGASGSSVFVFEEMFLFDFFMFMKDVVDVLMYLYIVGFVYCDIKMVNILFIWSSELNRL